MVLLRQNKIFDPLRKKWLVATPEERIRQEWIHYMIHSLQFPLHYLAIEKSLKELVILSEQPSLPNRRFDLVCFTQNERGMHPLLLFEFKAIPLSEQALQQIISYNLFIKSQFVCLANDQKIFTGWLNEKQQKYQFIDYLPSYQELLHWTS